MDLPWNSPWDSDLLATPGPSAKSDTNLQINVLRNYEYAQQYHASPLSNHIISYLNDPKCIQYDQYVLNNVVISQIYSKPLATLAILDDVSRISAAELSMASASGASGGGGGTSLNFKPVALAAHGVVAILWHME